MNFKESLTFGLSLAQGGEFGFVLIGFALTYAVFSQEIGNILTAVIALSMFLTPLILMSYQKVILPLLDRQKKNVKMM